MFKIFGLCLWSPEPIKNPSEPTYKAVALVTPKEPTESKTVHFFTSAVTPNLPSLQNLMFNVRYKKGGIKRDLKKMKKHKKRIFGKK